MVNKTLLFVLFFFCFCFFRGGFLLSLSLGFCLSVSVLVVLRELRCFFFCCASFEVEELGLAKREGNQKPQSDFCACNTAMKNCFEKLLAVLLSVLQTVSKKGRLLLKQKKNCSVGW